MIITLTGPSCAGKSTLEAELIQWGATRIVSTTTRQPRKGEVDGEHYYFVSHSEFKQALAEGGFVECVEFGENYYGTSVQELQRVLSLDKPVVVVCEPVGQKQIAKWCRDNGEKILAVFIDNPEDVIAGRFLSRMVEEVVDTKGKSVDKLVGTYARRLKEMMTTENKWREEAWSQDGASLYDIRVSRFMAQHIHPLVNEILSSIWNSPMQIAA